FLAAPSGKFVTGETLTVDGGGQHWGETWTTGRPDYFRGTEQRSRDNRRRMTRYRLAIFDFDGTLADSLPWFRASFQGMVERFGLAPVGADELGGLRGLTARQVVARLSVPLCQWPAIVSDMRRRKLPATSGISRFGGVRALLSDLR